jgi:DNA polymerase III epsilon subunit
MLYTIVDIETTGLSPKSARIIEVAAMRVYDGQIDSDHFHSLVYPGYDVSQFTTSLTGITNKDLLHAPKFAEIANDFVKYLGSDTIFVAHNAIFDRSFLDFELVENNHDKLSCDTLCTLKLSRKVLPSLKSHSLKSLIEYFEIDHIKNHRALDDVKVTVDIFLKLMKLKSKYNEK